MSRPGRILVTLLLLAGAMIILSAFLTLMYLESTDQKEETLMSSNDYIITIRTNETLQNVTLLLPLPIFNNTSFMGQEMISKDHYNKSPEWNFSLVQTEHGTMLKASSNKIVPTYRSLPVPVSEDEDPGYEDVTYESNEYSTETPVVRPATFTMTKTSDEMINTRHPFGNTSVLFPKYNLNLTEPESSIPTPEHIDPEYYAYESRIFAQYDTSEMNTVYISVELTGTNEWWVGGWRFNTFRDTVSLRLQGPQDSWNMAEGQIITGDGIYDE